MGALIEGGGRRVAVRAAGSVNIVRPRTMNIRLLRSYLGHRRPRTGVSRGAPTGGRRNVVLVQANVIGVGATGSWWTSSTMSYTMIDGSGRDSPFRTDLRGERRRAAVSARPSSLQDDGGRGEPQSTGQRDAGSARRPERRGCSPASGRSPRRPRRLREAAVSEASRGRWTSRSTGRMDTCEGVFVGGEFAPMPKSARSFMAVVTVNLVGTFLVRQAQPPSHGPTGGLGGEVAVHRPPLRGPGGARYTAQGWRRCPTRLIRRSSPGPRASGQLRVPGWDEHTDDHVGCHSPEGRQPFAVPIRQAGGRKRARPPG